MVIVVLTIKRKKNLLCRNNWGKDEYVSSYPKVRDCYFVPTIVSSRFAPLVATSIQAQLGSSRDEAVVTRNVFASTCPSFGREIVLGGVMLSLPF
jgi:hypothetical protein